MLRRTPIVLTFLAVCLSGAGGRDVGIAGERESLGVRPFVPTVDSSGDSVVTVSPDYVEFRLRKSFSGSTLTEAMEAALRLEPLLREELAQRKLAPVRFAFSGVTIPDVGKLEALASIHVRFDMAPLSDAETGPRDFAQLCDTLRALSGALSGSIEGPLLGVEEKAPIEQEAIAEAVRNAYVGAEAAAAVMEYQVEGVQKVDVLALGWRTESGAESATPDFRRVACEARVKVTYTIESL